MSKSVSFVKTPKESYLNLAVLSVLSIIGTFAALCILDMILLYLKTGKSLFLVFFHDFSVNRVFRVVTGERPVCVRENTCL